MLSCERVFFFQRALILRRYLICLGDAAASSCTWTVHIGNFPWALALFHRGKGGGGLFDVYFFSLVTSGFAFSGVLFVFLEFTSPYFTRERERKKREKERESEHGFCSCRSVFLKLIKLIRRNR